MAYDLSSFRKVAEEKTQWLSHELQSIRTGRATTALLDTVSLEVYGAKMRLQEVASLTVEDARTIYISPWDKDQMKAIEKAVTVADLGVSVGSDEKGVRVSFPELSSERRQQLIKLVRARLEDARIAVKNERTKTITDIEKNVNSEDETKRLKVDVQKIVDDTNTKLEEVVAQKEKDLTA